MKIFMLAASLAVLTTATPAGAMMTPHLNAGAACSASSVLNSVGDALTSGNDGTVLAAALAGEKRLTSCGNERDAVGAEMIAADAYGDVNQPAARCSALRDAARRSARLGDMTRSRAILKAARSCKA